MTALLSAVPTGSAVNPCCCGCLLTLGSDDFANFPAFTPFPDFSSAKTALDNGSVNCILWGNTPTNQPGVATVVSVSATSALNVLEFVIHLTTPLNTQGLCFYNTGADLKAGIITPSAVVTGIGTAGIAVFFRLYDSTGALVSVGDWTPTLSGGPTVPSDGIYMLAFTVVLDNFGTGLNPANVNMDLRLTAMGAITSCGLQAAYNTGGPDQFAPCP